LTREEFDLLLSDPEFGECLRSFGTDLGTLVALTGVMFQQAAHHRKLQRRSQIDDQECSDSSSDTPPCITFPEIFHAVLQLRGSNQCRVTDLDAVREYVRGRLDKIEARLKSWHDWPGHFSERAMARLKSPGSVI